MLFRSFTIKMQEGDDLMAHINHVKELADQLTSFEVPVREEDIVMTLLESLPPSFDNLIIALETLRLEDLTMAFVTARMMHEVTKRKEKESHGDDANDVTRSRELDSTSKDTHKVVQTMLGVRYCLLSKAFTYTTTWLPTYWTHGGQPSCINHVSLVN